MRAWLLAAWTGALLGACQLDLGAAAWVALAPLSRACHGARPARAAGLGLVAGAVGGAALYGLLPYGWLLYATMVGYCALNMALFGFALASLSGQAGTALRTVLPALLWTGIEYLRRFGPVSFPMMLGPTQAGLLPLWQVAALTGGHGLSFLVALPSGLVLAGGARRAAGPAAAMAAALALVYGLGAARMASPPPGGPAVRVAAIQPAIDNWVFRVAPVSRAHRERVTDELLGLTRDALARGARLVVWPETVVQRPLFGEAGLVAAVQGLADAHGASILVGAVREGPAGGLFNSAVVFRPGAGPVVQDKLRLAGWSEGRLTPGTVREALDTPAGRLGVMICLESVYPQDARALVAAGADLLVTTTDDAGFRRSPVAEIHVRRAGLRSIETGRWQLHVSQAGPSAATDPWGRTVARSGFWERTALVADVGRVTSTTPYQAVGDVFSWAVWASIGVTAWSARRGAASRRAAQKMPT